MNLRVPVSELGDAMVDTARADVARRWPKIAVLADLELRRLAQSLVDVAGLLASGAIDEPRARQIVHIYQVAARGVLLTVDGIGMLTAEQAIRAGIRAAAEEVNCTAKLPLV